MPNTFAYTCLALWPIVALSLYLSRPTAQATLWTILAGLLFLPAATSYKIQMIPVFDKDTIPSLCALAGSMLFGKVTSRSSQSFKLTNWLIVAFLVSPVISALRNTDTMYSGAKLLPGVGLYDGLSAALTQAIILIPFYLGRRFFRSASNIEEILWALAIAGLGYSVLLLWEVRFSPQLHYIVYGFYPSSFQQEIRGDGSFRPMAFMGHGLAAAFFTMTTVGAAAVFWRLRIQLLRLPGFIPTTYLSIVLLLCKSAGASTYCTLLLPAARWLKPLTQIRLAVVIATIAFLYPALRFAELVPTQSILEVARLFSTQRAQSLEVRFDQEEDLLRRAFERPFFGWGRFGRNRIYSKDTGIDLTVTDGHWIITIGTSGLFGFLAEFGLLILPILQAARAIRFSKTTPDIHFLASLSLIVALYVIDLIPNDGLDPWVWLLAGSVLGRSEAILLAARKRAPELRFGTNPSVRINKALSLSDVSRE